MSAQPKDAFASRVKKVAKTASMHADNVDTQGRFPSESIEEARELGLLAAPAPTDANGEGIGIVQLGHACERLAKECASTGMIYAMHAAQMLTISKYLGESRGDLGNLGLIASSTSETEQNGVTSSIEREFGRVTFTKNAPVISYAEAADVILVRTRRTRESMPNDQVLVLCPSSDIKLTATRRWNPLGMRGTRSDGYLIAADTLDTNVLETSFAEIASETMVPVTHVLWASTWLGIAQSAFDRASAILATGGAHATSSLALAEIEMKLQVARNTVEHELWSLEHEPQEPTTSSIRRQIRYNNVKLAASRFAREIVLECLSVSGTRGYTDAPPYGLGRHLRDSQSATVMLSDLQLTEINASLRAGLRGGNV